MTALTVALNLAASGLPVFPCGPNKRPAISKAEGGNGLHDATRDPVTIRRMFSRRNAILVGVPTGEASGFDVLDFDYHHGAAAWEQANLARLPETRTHQTQSAGRHLLFHHAPGVSNSAGRVALGVDIRGEGGYVIMPPSIGYCVIADTDLAHWPDWLLSLVLPASRAAASPRQSRAQMPLSDERLERIKQSVLDRVQGAADGAKHFTLRNAALALGGVAERAGFSDETAIRWLLDALPPGVKDWRIAEKTAAWGLHHGRARPIDFPDEPGQASDRRRKETARAAFRLLRMGVPSGELLAVLHEHNERRAAPLEPDVVADTVLWAARRMREGSHAQ
jgi:hypothetical protein